MASPRGRSRYESDPGECALFVRCATSLGCAARVMMLKRVRLDRVGKPSQCSLAHVSLAGSPGLRLQTRTKACRPCRSERICSCYRRSQIARHCSKRFLAMRAVTKTASSSSRSRDGRRQTANMQPSIAQVQSTRIPMASCMVLILGIANGPDVRDRHRVAVFADIDWRDPEQEAVLAGFLRHEIRHAEQWDELGQDFFDLYDLAEHVCRWKVGGLPHGSTGSFRPRWTRTLRQPSSCASAGLKRSTQS